VSSLPGGEERCDVENCANTVVQTAGYTGWLTDRLSPVANGGTEAAWAAHIANAEAIATRRGVTILFVIS